MKPPRRVLGYRQWQEHYREMERSHQRFERWFSLLVALGVFAAITTLVLVVTGALPLWLLLV